MISVFCRLPQVLAVNHFHRRRRHVEVVKQAWQYGKPKCSPTLVTRFSSSFGRSGPLVVPGPGRGVNLVCTPSKSLKMPFLGDKNACSPRPICISSYYLYSDWQFAQLSPSSRGRLRPAREPICRCCGAVLSIRRLLGAARHSRLVGTLRVHARTYTCSVGR